MQTTSQAPEACVHIVPGFAWDEQEAYLFDIDGTLLRNRDRIHRESFVTGVQQVTDFNIEPVLYLTPGGTDPAILREAIEKAGIPRELADSQWDAMVEAIDRACEERRKEMDIRILPGVEETLAHLARKGALLGVATGNLEAIGWIKIEEAGLRKWFQFGGFSDRFPIRAELVANATRKARELAGATARVCVVGDTPRDIEAARANGLPVISVATGNYSYETLLADGPDLCATSLADLLAMNQTGEG
ncbi:MAG: HAD family hydrolase [Terracidiphilus sp.]|jgi:phosphoglycolate phosphatase-like HAD superfamily hydrolase